MALTLVLILRHTLLWLMGFWSNLPQPCPPGPRLLLPVHKSTVSQEGPRERKSARSTSQHDAGIPEGWLGRGHGRWTVWPAHLVHTLAPRVLANVFRHPPRSGSCFSSFLPFHGQPFQLQFLLQTSRSTVLNEASCTELIKNKRKLSAEGLGKGMSEVFNALASLNDRGEKFEKNLRKKVISKAVFCGRSSWASWGMGIRPCCIIPGTWGILRLFRGTLGSEEGSGPHSCFIQRISAGICFTRQLLCEI